MNTPILHKSKSGKYHERGCLSLTHDGPCECDIIMVPMIRSDAQTLLTWWYGREGDIKDAERAMCEIEDSVDANPTYAQHFYATIKDIQERS